MGPADAPPRSRVGKDAAYALFVLTLIYGVGQLDRGVISLLLQGIKRDMQVSDSVLGLLSGFGFATLYVVSALFMSRWADRGPRRAIIAYGLGLYSVATALAGFSANIGQLTLSRVGVSIGESTGLAPSTAFIADYFPNEQRGRAMAIFAGGSYIATFVGYPVAGWINQRYGWRPAFMAAGVPGLVLALVFYFTVRDPPRGQSEGGRVDTAVAGLPETIAFLLRQRTALLIFVAAGYTGCTLFCLSLWGPTFLGRVHHLSPMQIGAYTGLIAGVAGLTGSIAGGFFSDWVGRRDPRLRLMLPAVANVLACPTALLYLFSADLRLTFTAQALTGFLMVFPIGATWAMLQSVVKIRMRALAAAILLVFSNLFGLGVGPLAVGILNDRLAGTLGAEAIRYSLLLPAATCAIGGCLLAAAALFSVGDRARALELRAEQP